MLKATDSKLFYFLCLSLKQVEILFILCKFPFYRHSHEKSEIDVALWFNIRDISCAIPYSKPNALCLPCDRWWLISAAAVL